MIKNYIVDRIVGILKGLKGIASSISNLFKKDWKGALADGKNALADLAGVNAMKNAVESGKKLGDKFKAGYQKGIANFAADKVEAGYIKDEKTGKWVKKKKDSSLLDKVTPEENKNGFDIEALMKKLGKNGKGKKNTSGTLSLGMPQNYGKSNTYAAITAKLGVKMPNADKQASPNEKPVKTIASRVDEINGSLKKMAAAVAIPVALTVGAANSGIEAVNPDTVTQKVVTVNGQTPTKKDETNGKSIYLDRFTDKIEIHVHGGDAPKEVAGQVRTEVEKALGEIFNV